MSISTGTRPKGLRAVPDVPSVSVNNTVLPAAAVVEAVRRRGGVVVEVMRTDRHRSNRKLPESP